MTWFKLVMVCIKFDCGMDDHCNIYTTSYVISFTLNMCVQYSMHRNYKRKEKKRKEKKETLSPGWYEGLIRGSA
jgi:hypothetical protein